MNTQIDLWHERLSDALRAVVMAYGGPKKMGYELWPTKRLDDAARHLNHCLDDDRAEKLSLEEVEHILRRGREIGVHVAMTYLCRSTGYADPTPVEPEDERAKLQREFIKASSELSRMMKRLEAMSHG